MGSSLSIPPISFESDCDHDPSEKICLYPYLVVNFKDNMFSCQDPSFFYTYSHTNLLLIQKKSEESSTLRQLSCDKRCCVSNENHDNITLDFSYGSGGSSIRVCLTEPLGKKIYFLYNEENVYKQTDLMFFVSDNIVRRIIWCRICQKCHIRPISELNLAALTPLVSEQLKKFEKCLKKSCGEGNLSTSAGLLKIYVWKDFLFLHLESNECQVSRVIYDIHSSATVSRTAKIRSVLKQIGCDKHDNNKCISIKVSQIM
jgi:hypothetical protein